MRNTCIANPWRRRESLASEADRSTFKLGDAIGGHAPSYSYRFHGAQGELVVLRGIGAASRQQLSHIGSKIKRMEQSKTKCTVEVRQHLPPDGYTPATETDGMGR